MKTHKYSPYRMHMLRQPKNKNNIYTVNACLNVEHIWQWIFYRPISSFRGQFSLPGHLGPGVSEEWSNNEQRVSGTYKVGILDPTSKSSQPMRDTFKCFTIGL